MRGAVRGAGGDVRQKLEQGKEGLGKGPKTGRPLLATPARLIRITLSLRPGEDDDLLAFFESIPTGRRAQAVLTALRQGGVGEMSRGTAAIDEVDLLAMLDDLLF